MQTQILAEPIKRVLAYIIDWIIAGAVTLIIQIPFVLVTGILNVKSASDLDLMFGIKLFMLGAITLFIFCIFYLVIPMFVFKGQTLGKKVLGLRIVYIDGGQASKLTLLKRYSLPAFFYLVACFSAISSIAPSVIANVMSIIVLCLSCIQLIVEVSNLVMLFSESRRTLFDKIGNTIVVQN